VRCVECPLSLACWSGNLGLDRARPELCPQCKRLVVAVVPEPGEIPEGITGLWYALKCEQRPWTRTTQRRWQRQQNEEKRREQGLTTTTGRYGGSPPHRIPDATEDPANRLPMGLVLGVCVICSGWVARWNGRYIDLDEQLQAEKEDA
jgi:hypothetical protein